jgi:hypothetical protein
MSAFYCDFHGQLECDDAVGFNVVETPQGLMYCCDDAMADMECQDELTAPVEVS